MKNRLGELECSMVWAVLLLVGISLSVMTKAQDKPAAKKMRTGIIFDTQAVDPEVFTRVEGAKKTVMVAVQEWDYGVKLFTAKEWRKRDFDNAEYRRNAERVADAVMEKMKPEYMRDSRGVILYAMIRSKDPFLSSILLSSKFLPNFKKTLGESVRVLILDRHLIYVFPESGVNLDEFGPALIEQYQVARQPVSLEVFQVTDKGFKVIGSIGR